MRATKYQLFPITDVSTTRRTVVGGIAAAGIATPALSFGLGRLGKGFGALGGLGGGRDTRWLVGFNKLKVAALAASGLPSHSAVMASPPTITTSTSISLLSGLTSVQAKWPSTNLGNLNLFGGQGVDVGSTYRMVNSDTISSLGSGQTAAWRAEGTFNAAKIGVQLNGNSVGGSFRFLVDDVYVSLTGTAPAGASGASYMLLDFTSVGGKTPRKIALECQKAQLWAGFFVAAGDAISKPAGIPVRMIFAGDSFVENSTGASIVGDGFSMIAGDLLGVRDTWMSGNGGTGFVNDAGGTKYTLGQRITDVTLSGASAVVIEMGLNDKGLSSSAITAQVTLDLAAIRSALPLAPIFVIPGWDVDAPSAPASSFAAMVAAVSAGMARWGTTGSNGMWLFDPTGVSYTKSDATHPDTAGHATLGAWVNTQIRALLAA